MLFPAAKRGMRRWTWRGAIHALDGFASREWRWLVVVAWLIISAWYLHLYSGAMYWLSLSDTDDNMRYLQVRDWLNGQSCGISRSTAWTRRAAPISTGAGWSTCRSRR